MIFSAFTSHTFISGSSSNQCSAHDVQHAYCVGCRWCCLPVLAPTFCIQVLTFVMCKEERPNAQYILLSIQPRKIDELLVRSKTSACKAVEHEDGAKILEAASSFPYHCASSPE